MSTTRDLTLFFLLVFGIILLLTITFRHFEIPMTRSPLTGKVEWMATDESNEITTVAIATRAGDYLVGDDAKGRELLQLVNKKVSVWGRVTEDERGQKTVHVSAYKMVPQ
jgi:hypothetical protein